MKPIIILLGIFVVYLIPLCVLLYIIKTQKNTISVKDNVIQKLDLTLTELQKVKIEQDKYIADLRQKYVDEINDNTKQGRIILCMVKTIKELAKDYSNEKGYDLQKTIEHYCDNDLTKLHKENILQYFPQLESFNTWRKVGYNNEM